LHAQALHEACAHAVPPYRLSRSATILMPARDRRVSPGDQGVGDRLVGLGGCRDARESRVVDESACTHGSGVMQRRCVMGA